MIVQVVGAFIAVFTIAVVQNVPKKFLFWGGAVSAVCWFVYLLCDQRGFSVAMSTLISTLVVALISHILARVFKAPVTVFLIPGFLPLVPGVNTYRIVYYLIKEDSANASYYGYLTAQIAGMIAIGIFIMDAIFRTIGNSARRKALEVMRAVYKLDYKMVKKEREILNEMEGRSRERKEGKKEKGKEKKKDRDKGREIEKEHRKRER